MSSRELAKSLIDRIPDGKMYYVLSFLQGAAIPDETPNAETMKAVEELDSGGGFTFDGSTSDLLSEILAEDD